MTVEHYEPYRILAERGELNARIMWTVIRQPATPEQVEAALEGARSAVHAAPDQVSGTVRITTTDTILVGLVAPALKALQAQRPNLTYDLRVGNELASLTRRDADIAVRATRRPPQHCGRTQKERLQGVAIERRLYRPVVDIVQR